MYGTSMTHKIQFLILIFLTYLIHCMLCQNPNFLCFRIQEETQQMIFFSIWEVIFIQWSTTFIYFFLLIYCLLSLCIVLLIFLNLSNLLYFCVSCIYLYVFLHYFINSISLSNSIFLTLFSQLEINLGVGTFFYEPW